MRHVLAFRRLILQQRPLEYTFLAHKTSTRPSLPRVFTAHVNGTAKAGRSQPVTYFQDPQAVSRPKLRWRLLRGSIYIAVLAFAGMYVFELGKDEGYELATAQDSLLQGLDPQMDYEIPQRVTAFSRAYDVGTTAIFPMLISAAALPARAAISHTASAASNMPCEDFHDESMALYHEDVRQNWLLWGVFDGHAGARIARLLSKNMLGNLILALADNRCFDDAVDPDHDDRVHEVIDLCFMQFDHFFCSAIASRVQEPDASLLKKTAYAMWADAGTCAIIALYDPKSAKLRVANVGDSRAVLGRWDPGSRRYIAIPMSSDHTGFNQAEVQRLKQEHPGEDPIDPTTGRLFGLAVTRAFGDARWKWPSQLTQYMHETLFTYPPRPNDVVETPPYLTARPEIKQIQIETGEHPDFLIVASDGLWDQLSSDEAVKCVQLWLDKFQPHEWVSEAIARHQGPFDLPIPEPTVGLPFDYEKNDLYYDQEDRALKWTNNEAHFIVERNHCGEHLIQNALGGDRKELFEVVMNLPPSHSRTVRDDITVSVVFFNADSGTISDDDLDLPQVVVG